MDVATAKMTCEQCRDPGYPAPVAPWLGCVACWNKFFEVDVVEHGQRLAKERNPLAVPAAQHQPSHSSSSDC